jgi:small subunit ribosomal protein S7
MPRRREVQKRPVTPDAKFHEPLVTRFINSLMINGKKSVAEGILYGAFDLIEERTKGADPVEVFKDALDKVKPAVEVKSRRVGGSTYQVPVELRSERRVAVGVRWIIEASRDRGEHTMVERLANELLDAANGRGNAVRRKEEMHRMADANKAFSHYRW